MKLLFDQIGIEVSSANKSDIDKRIHELVGVKYKNCPETWRAIKSRMTENQEKFLADLKRALSSP